jgi:hypothetical protein
MTMISFAHIVHPVIVDPSSDLNIAQPITFETMKTAREFAKGVKTTLYAVQYHDEKRVPLPRSFRRTPDITRCISDIKNFEEKRKLALIKDILDALYKKSRADYLIYTNVDIAVQPHFYQAVSTFIAQGYDAFIINRRTIPGTYTHVKEIPMMYSQLGEKHPGWDCFIFKRDLYPRFQLGTTCIGTDWIGRVMIINMASLGRRFKIFKDLHLTFHIGDDRIWKNDRFQDYREQNRNEGKKILIDFDKKYGPFNRTEFPGRFFRQLEKDQQEQKGNNSN